MNHYRAKSPKVYITFEKKKKMLFVPDLKACLEVEGNGVCASCAECSPELESICNVPTVSLGVVLHLGAD